MKVIEASPSRRRADDLDAPIQRASVMSRPILRRATAAARPARSSGVAMSTELRRAIHDHAQSAEPPAAPRDGGTAGLFGQAVNAGVHEAPAAAAPAQTTNPLGGLGGMLGNLGRNPLGALQGLAGNALGGAGAAIGNLASNPLAAIQGLFGSALSTGSLGDLASNPLGALQGLAGSALGEAGSALGNITSNPMAALQGIVDSAGSALGNIAGNPMAALQGLAGNALGGAGSALGNIASNPLGALQDLAGNALGGAGGALGNLASNPMAALQGLAGNALGGAGGALGNIASNPMAALQGLAGNALGGAGGALGNIASNPMAALQGLAGSALGAAPGTTASTPASAEATESADTDAPATDAPAATADLPPELVPLRTGLPSGLQAELDQLAATPEGLAAIQTELHAGGSRPPAGRSTAVPAAVPTGPVARHGAGDVSDTAADALGAATHGGATALPADLRGRFEASLRTDLSSVRIHADSSAAVAADAFGAHAFAHGQDIYFAAGQYQPGSPTGDHLIAHEIAHTVQQRTATTGLQYQLEVSEPGDGLEHAADRAADAMVAGHTTSITP